MIEAFFSGYWWYTCFFVLINGIFWILQTNQQKIIHAQLIHLSKEVFIIDNKASKMDVSLNKHGSDLTHRMFMLQNQMTDQIAQMSRELKDDAKVANDATGFFISTWASELSKLSEKIEKNDPTRLLKSGKTMHSVIEAELKAIAESFKYTRGKIDATNESIGHAKNVICQNLDPIRIDINTTGFLTSELKKNVETTLKDIENQLMLMSVRVTTLSPKKPKAPKARENV